MPLMSRPALLLPLALVLGGAAAPSMQGAAVPSRAAAPGDAIFEMTRVHRVHFEISAAEWAVLQTSTPRGAASSATPAGSDYRDNQGRPIHVGGGFGGYFPWVRANVRIESTSGVFSTSGVGLRYKGNLSFQSSSASAPLFANFKMKFDVFGADGRWDGVKTFNFHAGVVDTSKMREPIAYALFRAAGVPAPRTAYAQLFFTVPGAFQDAHAGLFTMIEDVNTTFLARALPPGKGLLMKPEGMRGGVQSLGTTWSAYVPTYRPDREATPAEQQRMMAFAGLVSQNDVALFRSTIGEHLDVEQFLRFLAVHAFIVNNDSYLRGGHNFYMYLDPTDNRVRFIPWDQDLSMASRPGRVETTDIWRPYSGDQPLIYWLLDDPAVNARYRAIVKELATTVFTPAALGKLMSALESVGAGQYNSPRPFLEQRAAYVQDVIAGRRRP
jgi:hypothetical protein